MLEARYTLFPEETWEEACWRVAQSGAASERGDKIACWSNRFYKELVTNRFIPGGRIFRNAGRPLQAMLNCFVIHPSEMDSREGWGETVKQVIIISGEGGGVGINGSDVRPRGTPVKRTGGVATGSVSLFEVIDAAARVIRDGGGRRAALMLCLNHDHPDLIEFMDKKLDRDQLNSANISVVFMNQAPEVFFEAVETGMPHALCWQDEVLAEVNSAEIWDRLVSNALSSGEPGILNGHLANKMNNLYYYKDLVATNPCGEVWLQGNAACDLGSIVLPKFLDENNRMDWDMLNETITAGVRFLDNVLDITHYPRRQIREEMAATRRIGLGVTGLADVLLMMGYKYESEEAYKFVDELMKFIKNKAYEASTYLAVEKGQFPACDREKFVKSGFIKTLKPALKNRIREYGIRNCALLSIAPTGTISLICGTSTGLEPIFAAAYTMRYDDENGEQAIKTVSHPMFAKFKEEGRNIDHFQGAYDVSPRGHLTMQATVQKHIDNSVSKTINLPPGFDKEELSSLLKEFLPKIKGVTVYTAGSRGKEPLTPISVDEALALACPGGVCDL
jgi:ribonucleoside-diphosphate reductase alpha chain